jgi:uridine phosphorylase
MATFSNHGFPKLRNKHLHQPVCTPGQFLEFLRSAGRLTEDFAVPDGVILCFDRGLVERVTSTHRVTTVETGLGTFRYLDDTDGKVALYRVPGIGAPCAAAYLEELIAAGIRRYVIVGTAGSLLPHLDTGSVVICERAIRDEGVSHHYLEASRHAEASSAMLERLRRVAERLEVAHHVGESWTIDAPYMETREEVLYYQGEGVATVEMEAAALFAVAQVRSAEIGAIFAVSDSLADLTWKPRFGMGDVARGLDRAFEVALRALRPE